MLSAHRALLAAVALAAVGPVRAAVTLPYLISEHMVVQRGLPVHIWGDAQPGEAVEVSFRGESRTAAADELGHWSVYLTPGDAGGPFELAIRGRNVISLKDVLVGDVWVAAGQSNMEWPLKSADNGPAETAAASHPRIRLARAMHRLSPYSLENFVGRQWAPCGPESVPDFSAVGYYFGRGLEARYGVPVGLIQTAWGGTPAEAWTSLSGLSSNPALMPVFAEWAHLTRKFPAASARYQRQLAAHPPEPPSPPKGPGGPWEPGAIYNGMVAPLTRFPIRGVIWYQGESNTAPESAPVYGRLFQTLIEDWRRAWGQGDFPFLFVQLANYRAAPDSMWPQLREAQRHALGLANTGMAVTIDIGNPDDIHPRNKQEVGRRLELAARAIVYGEKVEFSGPLFRQATREGGALRLWFDHAGAALEARGGALNGFEIAAADGLFVPAGAHIEGVTLVVHSEDVREPVAVRYGWADNPAVNLYNSAGLPASPFVWEPR